MFLFFFAFLTTNRELRKNCQPPFPCPTKQCHFDVLCQPKQRHVHSVPESSLPARPVACPTPLSTSASRIQCPGNRNNPDKSVVFPNCECGLIRAVTAFPQTSPSGAHPAEPPRSQCPSPASIRHVPARAETCRVGPDERRVRPHMTARNQPHPAGPAPFGARHWPTISTSAAAPVRTEAPYWPPPATTITFLMNFAACELCELQRFVVDQMKTCASWV